MLARAPLHELHRGPTHLQEPQQHNNGYQDIHDLSDPSPRFSGRITHRLRNGLDRACRGHAPRRQATLDQVPRREVPGDDDDGSRGRDEEEGERTIGKAGVVFDDPNAPRVEGDPGRERQCYEGDPAERAHLALHAASTRQSATSTENTRGAMKKWRQVRRVITTKLSAKAHLTRPRLRSVSLGSAPS